jgi:transcriptional regulator with XRE-family HTH domain
MRPDGEHIRRRRRRIGLDQDTFASRAGVDVKTLRRIESNQTQRPQAATVRAIAGVLGCRPEELFKVRDAAPLAAPRLGTALARCPECALPETDPSARFCRRCGQRVRESELGARKPATALAAHVQDRRGALDAESQGRLLDAVHEALRPGVQRFEGTLQRSARGSIAIFGAPIAHEDHAARACRCALWMASRLTDLGERLRTELGVEAAVGLGLHSGRIVLEGADSASGPLLERAADLAAESQSGRIELSEETCRAVRELFEIQAGPAQRYVLAPVVRAETRFDAARARGLAPLVGRRRELGMLHTALRELRPGGGRVVAVVGDPGVGKSRLCHDFAEDAHALGCSVRHIVCPSHARTVPLLAVVALGRALLGLPADAPADACEGALARALARLEPSESLNAGARLLLQRLEAREPDAAAPLPSPPQQELMFALLRALLGVEPGARPSVLIIEDVQSMDAASQRFLAGLVAAVRGIGVLVIVSFRPDHLPPWLTASCVDRVGLRPLERREGEVLVHGLLGPEASEPELVRRIAERAGGNPFVAEEVVQLLADSGKLAGEPGAYRPLEPIGELGLPPRVEDMVAARIDRLPPARRRILHAAAALETEVPEQLLAALSGSPSDELAGSLCELQWLDLLFEVHHGLERRFQVKHAIVREVAYQSLLREEREPDATVS